MRVFWALFDQDYLSPDRSYWTWHHDELSVAMLDDFYYVTAHQSHPSRTDRRGTEVPQSEIADVNPDWKCWYQYFDGGRDSQGRPGRYVLLCGFIKRKDFYQAGGTLPDIGRLPVIQRILESATQRPVPPPEDLSVDVQPEELLRVSDLKSEIFSTENESGFLSNIVADAQVLRQAAPLHSSPFPRNDHVEIASEERQFPVVKPGQSNPVKKTGAIGSGHRSPQADVGNFGERPRLGKFWNCKIVSSWQLIVGLLAVCVLLAVVISSWNFLSKTDRIPQPTVMNSHAAARTTPALQTSKPTIIDAPAWLALDSSQFCTWQVGLPLATFVGGLSLGLSLHWIWSTLARQRPVTPQTRR